MIAIPYSAMVLFISLLWLLCRAVAAIKNKGIRWKREAELLLVYICLLVVARITFCPMERLNDKLQPLLFDASRILPFYGNLIPFAEFFAYDSVRSAALNISGNVLMFVPIGIIWPLVFKELNRHWKVIAAGVGFSLSIELLQILFFERFTDVNDLILNSFGYLLGYGLYLLLKK